MNKINDVTALKRGRYRAEFGGRDLGILTAPPEISADFESVSLTVCDETSSSGYDDIENSPRLFGSVKLYLGAVSEALQMLFGETWRTGELVLTPEFPGTGIILRFPAAQLLPKWDFIPEQSGNHALQVFWRLRTDSAGKLFYTA